MACAEDNRTPRSRRGFGRVTTDDATGFYVQMTRPVVSRRSWQLADLSRTVDDTMLALEYDRLHLKAAPSRTERRRLQRDLATIIDAVVTLLVGGAREQTVRLSSEREVLVPDSIVNALRRWSQNEGELKSSLERLASELRQRDEVDSDLVEVIDTISEAADVEATASMRPLMRQ